MINFIFENSAEDTYPDSLVEAAREFYQWTSNSNEEIPRASNIWREYRQGEFNPAASGTGKFASLAFLSHFSPIFIIE